MKTNLTSIFLLLVTSSLFIECGKEGVEKTSQMNLTEFDSCFNSNPHDSATVANKLVGTWNWNSQSCYVGSSVASPDKIVKATFSSTGIVTVIENSSVITQGNWKVKMIGYNFNGVDSTTLELSVDEPSSYLYGVILICDNQLLLYRSYADGCNTLFTKE